MVLIRNSVSTRFYRKRKTFEKVEYMRENADKAFWAIVPDLKAVFPNLSYPARSRVFCPLWFSLAAQIMWRHWSYVGPINLGGLFKLKSHIKSRIILDTLCWQLNCTNTNLKNCFRCTKAKHIINWLNH